MNPQYRTALPCVQCGREVVSDSGQTCETCARELETAALKQEWEADASRGAAKQAGRRAFQVAAILGGLLLALGLGILVSVPFEPGTGYVVGSTVGILSIGPFVLVLQTFGPSEE